MRLPARIALVALVAPALVAACARTAASDPGEALLGHLTAMVQAASAAGNDCPAVLAAAEGYLSAHREEIERLKARLVEQSRDQSPEERTHQAERLRTLADELVSPAMATLMDIGMRCPQQVPRLKEAMSFTDIAP